MKDFVEFFVQGEPRPQGSKTPVVRGGRAFLIEGSGKAPALHKAWRAKVAKASESALSSSQWTCEGQGNGPVAVFLKFYLLRPKSRASWLTYCDRKPDVDKLTRAVLDSLTGTILKDDSRVVHLTAEKYYVDDESEMGVNIHVEQVIDTKQDTLL